MVMVPDVDVSIQRILDALEEVRTSAGRIHDREQEVIYEDDLEEKFIDEDGQLRVTLVIDPNDDEEEDEGRQTYYLGRRFTMIHYLAFNIEADSKRAFRKELQDIQNKFRHNQSVFGIPERPEHKRHIVTTARNLVMLGDSFVHEGIMELTIESKELQLGIF